MPNPIDLKADWLTYFQVDKDKLDKRIQEVNTFLNALQSHLDTTEELQEAKKRITKLISYIELLILIKKQVIENPTFAWLPKTTYTLNDFVEISDRTLDLKLDISHKQTDLTRLTHSANNLSQTLNQHYAKYLSLPPYTPEKFFQGLEVMTMGIRVLYLEAEAELNQHLIELDKQMLDRYQKEFDFVNKNLDFSINLEKIAQEKKRFKKDLIDIHHELLNLEFQSIKTAKDTTSDETSRRINQKLTHYLIKETLTKAKYFLLEIQTILYNSHRHSKKIEYETEIKPIKTFIDTALYQLTSWENLNAAEIDRLSQHLINIKEKDSAKIQASAEESLKLYLANKSLLHALSKEIYHIESAIKLIDYNKTKNQTIIDQFTYTTRNCWQWFTGFFETWSYYSLFTIGGVPITPVSLFKATLIFLASIGFSHLLRRTLKRLAKGKADEPALYAFRRIVHYLILFIGILLGLSSLGLTVRNMAIVFGALSIGVGFGLQKIVNNFLCGLTMLFERSIKIGDLIELKSGLIGKISEVNVQNTTLHTLDGLDIIVPNSSFFENNVINWTKKHPYKRLHVPFSVSYGTDQEKVSKIVCEAAMNVPSTIMNTTETRKPEVWLVEFGENSLKFELIVWINLSKSQEPSSMQAAYLSVIEIALKTHNISIPFPQRDLHLKTIPKEGFNWPVH